MLSVMTNGFLCNDPMKENPVNDSQITSLGTPLAIFLLMAFVHSQTSLLGNVLPEASQFASRVLGILMWLTGSWLLGRILDRLVLNPLILSRTGTPAPRILSNCLSATLFIATIFCIIRFVFDKPIGGLVATSGIVTVIIGFAIRDMIADFFSGLAMNIEQPYRIGDWLQLDDIVGRVTEMNWRATRLVTQSRRSIVVPNNNLASRQFTNISRPEPYYRESLDIVLNYTTDPARVENILLSAIHATEGLASQRHDVRIMGFQERGVTYQVRFWVNDYTDAVRVRHRLAANVLEFLSQAGIPIPYAQHEVVLTRERRPRKERRINARRLLSRVSWLEMLTDDELDQLAEGAVGLKFATGRTVVTEGEDGSALYVLVEGVLEVVKRDDNGNNAAVGKIQPGQAFGEMSLLTGAPRMATVNALTDVFVLEIRRANLEPILRARPAIADELGQVMARRQIINERNNSDDEVTEECEDFRSRAIQLGRRISQMFGL